MYKKMFLKKIKIKIYKVLKEKFKKNKKNM